MHKIKIVFFLFFIVFVYGCHLSEYSPSNTSMGSSTTSASSLTGQTAPNTPLPPSGMVDTRPYWPLGVGYFWNYKNAGTGAALTVSVASSPAQFGTSPLYISGPVYQVLFQKNAVNSYWDIGAPWDLSWYLGYTADGTLISTGDYLWDYTTGLQVGDVWSLYSLTPNTPPYTLIKPGAAGTSVSYLQAYSTHPGITDNALYNGLGMGNDQYLPTNWAVTWSDAVVSVPAFTGAAVMAEYNEGGQQIEDWYYAQGVGVVKIISKEQGGVPFNPPVEMDLQSYSLVPQNLAPSPIPFRSQLVFAADTYIGLNFYQWNYYWTQLTGQTGPAPQAVCYDPSLAENLIDVDTYLALMSQLGTCTTTSGSPGPSPTPTPSCQFLVNDSPSGASFDVGQSPTYTLISNQAGLNAYFLGTKDGTADVPATGLQAYYFNSDGTVGNFIVSTNTAAGITFVYPPFTIADTAYNPGYTRQVQLRDSNGNTVCTTNSILISVFPQ